MGSWPAVKKALATLPSLLMSGVALAAVALLGSLFILGGVWASSKLLPWFSLLARISFGLVVFVILPLAIPRATRGASSVALFIASYVFGAALWMYGFLLSFLIWGAGAVIIGLLILGVGVVPIAMLATLVKEMWTPLIELVLLTIMTFGSRFGALAIAANLEKSHTIPGSQCDES